MILETAQEKLTLSQLLDRFNRMDDDALTFDPEMLRGDLAIKVDDYKSIIDHYEAIGQMFAEQAAALSASATAAKNKAKRIKELLQYNMEAGRFEKLPGIIWRAQIETRKGLKIVSQELLAPTASTYLKYPDFVERTYSTKAKDLLDAAKLDPAKFEGIVAESSSSFVKFYTNTVPKASKKKDQPAEPKQ